VIAAAKANGISDRVIEAAQQLPVYKFVKLWGLALPLHPEFRTLPMLFYVPPLLPVMASVTEVDTSAQAGKMHTTAKYWPDTWRYDTTTADYFGTIDDARFPLRYMASLFSAGDTGAVAGRLKKLMAVRLHRRQVTVGDLRGETVAAALDDSDLTPQMADDIYYLTSLARFDDRFVIPPMHREEAIEMLQDPRELADRRDRPETLEIRGVQLTPQMIEEIVRGFPEVEEFFTTVENRDGLDTLLIKFELKSGTDSAAAEQIASNIKQQVKTHIGFSPEVGLEPHNLLPRFELKARRFKDLRVKVN